MKGKNNDEKVKHIEDEIAKETIETIMQETKGLDPQEGGFSTGHMWKLKNKIIPKPINVPTAMKNPEGKLCTSKKDIDEMSMDYFKNVLRNREIKEGLEGHREEKEELFKLRLEYTETVKTPPWTRVEVERAMKGLKSKKSRDPTNIANEIFNPKVAGDDLIEAVQHLMNRIKSDLVYPECLKLVNISSIYKKKGPINEFSSYRGIFRVQALRNILELLLYYDEYSKIDSNLTDSNVGCRKNRNIRDNIFVLQAILNDNKNGSKEPIDISVYDVKKCFDSLWVQDCINDMFDAGIQSDKLNVLYLLNKDAQVAVKTTNGITQRETISNIIMQGTVWGGMFCTTSMDKLAKLQYENPDMLYRYKGSVGVPVLEMVDDILDVKKCGKNAVTSNALVNTFVEHKKLKMALTNVIKYTVERKQPHVPP